MSVSTSQVVTLSASGEEEITTAPCVITSVIVTELTGTAAAAVALTGHSDARLLMNFAVPGGESVVWAGEPVAAGSGVVVSCQYGDVAVTVAYR